ncbi:MAG: PAS domain S-box protein [Limnobacter sp.]|nr:PAS domain S-box protein [Limnobacter sp.]
MTPAPENDAAQRGQRVPPDFSQLVAAVIDYAIFFVDADGIIRSWNAGAELIEGYRAHEAIGQPLHLLYPPGPKADMACARDLGTARRAGRFVSEGWRMRKDGSEYWADIVITALFDEQGELIGYSHVTRDATARHAQEERLRQSEELYRLLVAGVRGYAIFALDVDGNVVNWNDGAQRTKGYTADEVLGRHFSLFYPPDAVARGWPEHELASALENGVYEEEGWRIHKDGGRFWASVMITPIYDSGGRHIGFTKITRDLTDKHRISRLEDENRRISHFLAMLGHELRNPLAPISYALALVEQPDAKPELVARMHELIARQVRQISRLVDDLLDVGRIVHDKIRLTLHPLPLRELVAQAVETAATQAAARGQQIEFDAGDAADVWVDGDSARLLQVIGNLLGNAIKFTPTDTGRIAVELARTGRGVEIRVRDNGPGIPPDQLSAVFEMFAQRDVDGTASTDGLGLGLSLARALVELHGGTIGAYSTGRAGEGCEFVVQLPTIAAPRGRRTRKAAAASPELPEALRPPSAARSILVVDGDADAADTLRLLLESAGHPVTVARSAQQALEAAKRERFDAVLTDLRLPDYDGLQLAGRIRALPTEPPRLIALTSAGRMRDRRATQEAGFASHLIKPVSAGELFRALDARPEPEPDNEGGIGRQLPP